VTPGDDYPREKEDLALAAVVGWALGGTGHGDTPVIARAGSLALVRPDRPVVVDGKTGKELARLVTAGACRAETMALDAEWAACVGDDGRPRVWIARSGKLLFTGEAEGRRRCVGARSAAVVPCGGNL
jgi:hypothetical protein